MFFLVFRDSKNENSQLKYAQKELLDKLEAQQKEFDTKQSVSGAQNKIIGNDSILNVWIISIVCHVKLCH